jgi:SAM-dependent methyltransferase
MNSRHSTDRFSDRVENYIRYRPDYPRQVIEALSRDVGLSAEWTIADVGSGTGISSRLFLEAGCEVYGIEPNGPMREAAERLLAGCRNFHSVSAPAERTTLPEASVDAVVAGQAFHWFEPEQARTEFRRILRAPKWTILMWNSRRLDATPFLKDYEALLDEFGTDYEAVRHDRISATAIAEFFEGEPAFCYRFDNRQQVDLAGFEGRLLSSSYLPSSPSPAAEAMLQSARRLFNQHEENGRVCIEYDVEVYVGRL